jgi:thiol-disulfide isomerase/thioredoxin
LVLGGCDRFDQPNKIMPELGLRDLKGDPILSASMKGRPWVINVWLPGCDVCARQVPALEEVRAEFEPKGVGFLALSVVPEPATTRDWAKEMGIATTVAVASGPILDPLGVRGTPSTLIVDKSGRIVVLAQGKRSRRFFAARLREVMQGQ